MKGDSSYLGVRSGVESTRNLRAGSVGNSGQSRGSNTETLLLFSGAFIRAGLSLCAFGLGGFRKVEGRKILHGGLRPQQHFHRTTPFTAQKITDSRLVVAGAGMA